MYGKLGGKKNNLITLGQLAGYIIRHMYNYTIRYVDYSTNMLSSNNIHNLEIYVNNYFKLLENFYNINKLTLNQDKSKFMIVCKANMRNNCNDITMKTSNFIIQQSNKI